MNDTSGCSKLHLSRLDICALIEPCSVHKHCFNNHLLSLSQNVWQEECPLFDDGCADWLQLPADLLHQLGDVHSALPHSGDGTDL